MLTLTRFANKFFNIWNCMLKKIFATSLIVLATLKIQLSYAEMPGFYAAAQLGYGNTHIDTGDLVTIFSGITPVALPDLRHAALAYRLSFGYQFNKNFAAELGYRRFSNASINLTIPNQYIADASSKESAYDLVGKAILPLSCKLIAYGKLGLAYVKPNSLGYANVTPLYMAITNNYSNTLEPTFGLGLSYALQSNVPVDISWNRIQKLGGGNPAPSSDFYALGVSYYFG
jgi:OmpA-OmpF porin, OOP family